jgi:hypothetical protein
MDIFGNDSDSVFGRIFWILLFSITAVLHCRIEERSMVENGAWQPLSRGVEALHIEARHAMLEPTALGSRVVILNGDPVVLSMEQVWRLQDLDHAFFRLAGYACAEDVSDARRSTGVTCDVDGHIVRITWTLNHWL